MKVARRSLAAARLAALLARLPSPLKRIILWFLREVLDFGLWRFTLPSRVTHIHGPAQLDFAEDELIVTSVVRDGEAYVRSFVEHYFALGARHLVFLDNGSTDRTIELLRTYPNVTVLQARVPYARYENAMKRYLVERFARGRWVLFADIDELFDYPCSGQLGLRDLLRYLDAHRYTAVLVQMLDMVADAPLNALWDDEPLKERYPYYDVSAIHKSEYPAEKSTVANPSVKMHAGGIRQSIFGSVYALTKASLVKIDGRIRTFIHWHHATHARLADISCLFLHYPIVSTFRAKVEHAIATGNRGVATPEYLRYWRTLERTPELNLKLPTSRRFESVDALVKQGFLVVSEQYRTWVQSHPSNSQRTTKAGSARVAGTST